MRKASFLLAWLVAAGPASAGAETVVLSPSKDNTLFESATGELSSGSGPALFIGANSGLKVRRALLAFDVAAHIPAGAMIESVTIRLVVSNAPNETPRAVEVHRLLAAWGEGASSSSGGGGAPAQAGDATWLHRFHPDSLWTSPGGDFDPEVRAVTTVLGAGSYTWSDSALVTDVQSWLDDPASNFGWMLTGEETVASSARRIESREAPEAAERPELSVEFRRPISVERSTWGGVKGRYVHPRD